MGLPVVGTRVTGVLDAVVHGETGMLVPVQLEVALGAALGAYVADSERRHLHGYAGRRRVVASFSRRAVHTAIDAFYQACASERAC